MRLLLGLLFCAACSSDSTVPYNAPSELLLLDVAGTWYGPAGAQPRSHLLLPQTRLPALGGSPQYVDPDWMPTSGCAVNRYDESARPIPNIDQLAGEASYSGYETNLLAADRLVPRPPGVYAPPVPGTLRCVNDGVKPYYLCRLGDVGGIEKVAGLDPRGVWFPAVAPAVFSANCPGCPPCDMKMIPDGAGGMMAACEQHPFADGATIIENLGGGGGYSALVNIGLPPIGGAGFVDARFVRFVVGGVEAPSLDAVTLDGMHDLAVQWTCDPTATTPGSASCPPSLGAGGAVHLVTLMAISSTSPKSAFSPGSQYSFAQCFAPIDDGRATLTLKRDALQTLLGGAPNGTVLIALARVVVKTQTSLDHAVFAGAGRGQFALVPFGTGPDAGVPADLSGSD